MAVTVAERGRLSIGEFTEVSSRSEGGHELTVDLYLQRTIVNDVALEPGRTLLNNNFAGGHIDFVAEAGQLFQLLVGATGEQRYGGEMGKLVELGGLGHERSSVDDFGTWVIMA